jgi:hypothetical protein
MTMQSDDVSSALKHAYHPPVLQRLGRIRDLTAGGSNQVIPELGGNDADRQKPN